MGKIREKWVYWGLGATPKSLQTSKSYSTPGENIIFALKTLNLYCTNSKMIFSQEVAKLTKAGSI